MFTEPGSTFPKAKPKQSLLTVLRLALIRFVFLPIYAKWWVAQTSPKIFAFFLTLYSLQMFNWAVYSYNVNKNDGCNDTESTKCSLECDKNGESQEHFVSLTELLVPLALSLALSLIHSQIVATASNNTLSASKQRKYGGDALQAGGRKRRERRKRKKHIRIRSALNCPATEQTAPTVTQKSCLAGSNRNSVGTDNTFVSNAIDMRSMQLPKDATKMVDLHHLECVNVEQTIETSPQLRKRNVYWDSPIKSHLHISAKIENDSNEDSENAIPTNGRERSTDHTAGDDDGFESLNGKSSSGEEMMTGAVEAETINDDTIDGATMHMSISGADGECNSEAINGNIKVSEICEFF